MTSNKIERSRATPQAKSIFKVFSYSAGLEIVVAAS